MKKIGIIGGMGPEATLLFYQEIIRICQQRWNAKYDADYPEMYICNLPLPDVVGSMEDRKRSRMMLRQSARKLQDIGADFLVIPCNTAHIFAKDIEDAVDIPFLNIVEETVKRCRPLGKVGILGTEATLASGLYQRELELKNVLMSLPTQQEKKAVTEIIFSILSGRKDEKDRRVLQAIIDRMLTEGAQSVILGCTDLPILLKDDPKLIDTIKVLAEATMEYAKK